VEASTGGNQQVRGRTEGREQLTRVGPVLEVAIDPERAALGYELARPADLAGLAIGLARQHANPDVLIASYTVDLGRGFREVVNRDEDSAARAAPHRPRSLAVSGPVGDLYETVAIAAEESGEEGSERAGASIAAFHLDPRLRIEPRDAHRSASAADSSFKQAGSDFGVDDSRDDLQSLQVGPDDSDPGESAPPRSRSIQPRWAGKQAGRERGCRGLAQFSAGGGVQSPGLEAKKRPQEPSTDAPGLRP